MTNEQQPNLRSEPEQPLGHCWLQPLQEEGGKSTCVCGGGRARGALQGQPLMIMSFSPTAKFKDRVDTLSKLAKAKAETLEGQGSQPGECRKSQHYLPCFALPPLTFPARKAQGQARKLWGGTQILCCSWAQMAAVTMQQESIDARGQEQPSPEELLVRQGRERCKGGLQMAMELGRREGRALQTALGCCWSLADPANEVFVKRKHLHLLAEEHRRFLQRE